MLQPSAVRPSGQWHQQQDFGFVLFFKIYLYILEHGVRGGDRGRETLQQTPC